MFVFKYIIKALEEFFTCSNYSKRLDDLLVECMEKGDPKIVLNGLACDFTLDGNTVSFSCDGILTGTIRKVNNKNITNRSMVRPSIKTILKFEEFCETLTQSFEDELCMALKEAKSIRDRARHLSNPPGGE